MTNIYAITDSHQEARNLGLLLSGIYNFEKNNIEPFLILDCGDLFKGVYDKNLSVYAYLKLKELLPQSQIYITLGNNDFGFNKNDFNYLKNTIKIFQKAGINVICANIKNNKTNMQADFVPQYKIININTQKILITGFCINNSCAKKFGYSILSPAECYKNLIETIDEKYDKIIVLNHHWYPYSLELKKSFNNIDLIIGGHEHSPIEPDYQNNIFYPLSFARTLYKITLSNQFENIQEIPCNAFKFYPEFETPIIDYETKTELKKTIAKRVLNLTKKYSEPCPLGTFISDNMKLVGNTDIAFHSTGFTMHPLKLSDSNIITKYDIEQVICAASTIEKIDITTEQLKKVFENATEARMHKNHGNSKFLQCSGNITIVGEGDEKKKTYRIIQISINGENLLDSNQKPISNKKYSCTIDHYIGSGEQGYEILKNIPKIPILKNGKAIHLNELFYEALCNAEKNYKGDSEYPSFKLIDKKSVSASNS